jgi:hypothetical protein
MDQNNQPQNHLPAPLDLAPLSPHHERRLQEHIVNRPVPFLQFLQEQQELLEEQKREMRLLNEWLIGFRHRQEQLRLSPRTFISQTRMLIGKTTKGLAVGTHVFCPCFVGNTHVRVGLDIPVRLNLMQVNNYDSRPWVFCRFSFFQKPVRSIGIGTHLSRTHENSPFETVLFDYRKDVHRFIQKDTSFLIKSQDSKSLPMQLVSNDIVASEKPIQSLQISSFSFLNVFVLLFVISVSSFTTFLFMNNSNTNSTSVKQLKPNDLEITFKNFNDNKDPNNKQ